jgi:glycine/serine hydroxymethyltransferase
MGAAEMDVIAEAIAVVLSGPQNPAKIAAGRQLAEGLCQRFPLPY